LVVTVGVNYRQLIDIVLIHLQSGFMDRVGQPYGVGLPKRNVEVSSKVITCTGAVMPGSLGLMRWVTMYLVVKVTAKKASVCIGIGRASLIRTICVVL